MPSKRTIFGMIALIALVVAGTISIAARTPRATTVGATPAAPPATVAAPIVDNVAVTESYPAEIEPVERVELRPRVSGHIDAIHFREGDEVSRGQLLFRIDPRPFQAALAEAEAQLAQTVADAETAKREEDRAARLLQRRAISQEVTDRRAMSADVAAARVAAAEAAVERARLNLTYTEVRSPIAGRIGRAESTRGNLVGPETRLAVVVSTDPLYVRFDVDENRLNAYGSARGKWSIAFTPAGETEPRIAQLAFVDNEIGRGTGTLRVRARVANHDGALIPGMFGNVEVAFGEQPDALLVREEAIGADQGQRFVLVAGKDNVLQYRPVTLGARHDDLRVVTSGLKPSDRVVVNGLFRLRPGTAVTPHVVPMVSAKPSKES